MAVPPMIGTPGAFVFYSGDPELFEEHRDTLAVPAGTEYVGADPGLAALHDVALLTGMYGMFAGITSAFALMRDTDVAPKEFAPLLVSWLNAMVPGARHGRPARLRGLHHRCRLQPRHAGRGHRHPAAHGRGTGDEPGTDHPFFDLMHRRLADGHGTEDTTGLTDLLRTR
ncbi:hypothetical protein ACFQ3Z_16580 [Streptomyces nogalater]